jgi:hypothetical protein
MIPRDALVQAVVQGMVVALGFATIVFAGLAVATAAYFNVIVSRMESRITRSVTSKGDKALRRIEAHAFHRFAFFEWQQSETSSLSEQERAEALQIAINYAEQAYALLRDAGVSEPYEKLMVWIKNNLAWFYSEANMTKKAAVAKEFARSAADQYGRYRELEWLFTKAQVLAVFASNADEADEAIRTYRLIDAEFGHLPDVSRKVAARLPNAQAVRNKFS